MQRTITVYNSTTQKKTVLENVDVNTLGELKAVFSQKNIDFTDMDFQEGVSQTQLINDSSILPSNIDYKGKKTNDLVIFLTLKNNKIKSGTDLHELVDNLSRRDLIVFIKTNGLADKINSFFNQNYTRVASDDLRGFIHTLLVTPKEECEYSNAHHGIVEAFKILVEDLYNVGILERECVENIYECLGASSSDDNKGFSMKEILDMKASLEGLNDGDDDEEEDD